MHSVKVLVNRGGYDKYMRSAKTYHGRHWSFSKLRFRHCVFEIAFSTFWDEVLATPSNKIVSSHVNEAQKKYFSCFSILVL